MSEFIRYNRISRERNAVVFPTHNLFLLHRFAYEVSIVDSLIKNKENIPDS